MGSKVRVGGTICPEACLYVWREKVRVGVKMNQSDGVKRETLATYCSVDDWQRLIMVLYDVERQSRHAGVHHLAWYACLIGVSAVS